MSAKTSFWYWEIFEINWIWVKYSFPFFSPLTMKRKRNYQDCVWRKCSIVPNCMYIGNTIYPWWWVIGKLTPNAFRAKFGPKDASPGFHMTRGRWWIVGYTMFWDIQFWHCPHYSYFWVIFDPKHVFANILPRLKHNILVSILLEKLGGSAVQLMFSLF